MPRHKRSSGGSRSSATRARRRSTLERSAAWAVIGAVAVAGLAFALSLAPGGNVEDRPAARSDERAPEIVMTDFGGKRFALSDYKGKPLVVNFWASWCPPCAAEMPDFEKVHQSVAGKVAFLGVNQSDARGRAEDLARQTGVTYRLAEDPQGEAFRAFGSVGMPTTAFIDASGKVVDVVAGQLSAEALIDYIERSFPEVDVG